MEQECAISIKAYIAAIEGLPNKDILMVVDGAERWRDVKGFKGLYQVSDRGRVRVIGRVVSHYLGGPKRLKSRILKPALRGKSRHLSVHLWKEGRKWTVLVHRLVLAAFIGDCPEGQEPFHGPAGAFDNSVRNLSYGKE